MSIKDEFQWRLHPTFDDMSIKWSQDPAHFLPVIDMSPLYLRPDAHPAECLHYCTPGPRDLFATLLMQMLSENAEGGVQKQAAASNHPSDPNWR